MTYKRKVDGNEIVDWLTELADAKPDGYAYERNRLGGCVNVDVLEDGTLVPSCIIGSLFIEKLGVDIEDVPRPDTAGSMVEFFSHRFEFSDRAKAIMGVAQTLQDQGVPWRVVARITDSVVGSVASRYIGTPWGDVFASDSK